MKKELFPVVTDNLILQPKNKEDIWAENWTVSLEKEPDRVIGSLDLDRKSVPGEIAVSLELDPEYRNQGYGSEVFYAVSELMLSARGIREVTAVCKQNNKICIRALEKAGFVLRETVRDEDHYSVKKDKSAWTGLYMCIGFVVGLILGILISNLWAGMAIGLLAGFVIGHYMDTKENKDIIPDNNDDNRKV